MFTKHCHHTASSTVCSFVETRLQAVENPIAWHQFAPPVKRFAALPGFLAALAALYETVSDVPESRLWFASKNLMPRRMN